MERFNLIDRYIAKKFIATFFLSLLLIIVIVIIFDLSEKIDYFVKNEAPLKAIIFDYYCNYIPYLVNMFASPLLSSDVSPRSFPAKKSSFHMQQ